RQVPWVIAADVGVPTGETDQCRALDGAPAAVRCASSLEGRDAAGALAARAALAGEAVLLEGLDRWYRLGPEGAGYCRSCELALVEYLREAYGAVRSRAEAGRGRSSCGGQRGASAALCRAGDGVRRRSVARRRRAAAGAGGSRGASPVSRPGPRALPPERRAARRRGAALAALRPLGGRRT